MVDEGGIARPDFDLPRAAQSRRNAGDDGPDPFGDLGPDARIGRAYRPCHFHLIGDDVVPAPALDRAEGEDGFLERGDIARHDRVEGVDYL